MVPQEGAQTPSWLVVGDFSPVKELPVSLLPPETPGRQCSQEAACSNPQRLDSPMGLLHISIIESSPKDFSCELD